MPMKNVLPNVRAVVRYVQSRSGMTGSGATFHSTKIKAKAVIMPMMRRTMTVGDDQAYVVPPDEMGMRMNIFAANERIAP